MQNTYDVDLRSPELLQWIDERARAANKQRKNDYKKFYNVYKDVLQRNGIPYKLDGKKDQWRWLVEHYDSKLMTVFLSNSYNIYLNIVPILLYLNSFYVFG